MIIRNIVQAVDTHMEMEKDSSLCKVKYKVFALCNKLNHFQKYVKQRARSTITTKITVAKNNMLVASKWNQMESHVNSRPGTTRMDRNVSCK